MKAISVFNNKGGVGKTTLTFHIGHALAEMGKRVLMLDADPQCNLTIYALPQEFIHKTWEAEDGFIDEGFETTKNQLSKTDFQEFNKNPRSIHYLLKPTEEGTGDLEVIPPPVRLAQGLDIIPGRLTLHLYEEKIANRWNDIYRGEALSLRTITKIRAIAETYASLYGYDYVIIDTSPSLGAINKVVISTVDGFFIPASPDLFSLYGIRNIGKALKVWKSEFDVIFQLISNEKRKAFPEQFVTFLGYTIYNAKKYTSSNKWDLAKAHLHYANQIPQTIIDYIDPNLRSHLDTPSLNNPIGETAVMHTHNTFPSMAQNYNLPMWRVPSHDKLRPEHTSTLAGSRAKYEDTKEAYIAFCNDLLNRINLLDRTHG